MTADDYVLFKKNIYAKIGLDLNSYKERQLKRRILQFMTKYHAPDFSYFFKLLDANPELLRTFKDYLTINTSEFFRDLKVVEHIKNRIMIDLAKASYPVKIWSAGCSIGAEPYSLAILAREANLKNVHILATDYDVTAIEKAKVGNYPSNLLKNIPGELVNKYFTLQGDGYIIKNDIMQDVVYKEQNLLKDTFPSGFDLILCRNVFIYFTQEAQQDLTCRFIKSLNQGGYFIVGSSEFINTPESLGCIKVFPSIYQKI